MVTIEAIAIFFLCLIGCGVQAWRLGRHQGIEDTVTYMINEGLIEVDEE